MAFLNTYNIANIKHFYIFVIIFAQYIFTEIYLDITRQIIAILANAVLPWERIVIKRPAMTTGWSS